MKMTKKGDKEKGVGTFFKICYKFCVHSFLKIGRGGKKNTQNVHM
jgi:hypothetical protein